MAVKPATKRRLASLAPKLGATRRPAKKRLVTKPAAERLAMKRPVKTLGVTVTKRWLGALQESLQVFSKLGQVTKYDSSIRCRQAIPCNPGVYPRKIKCTT